MSHLLELFISRFVDGLMLLTNCPREISFMIAQPLHLTDHRASFCARKSWDRPLVGFLAPLGALNGTPPSTKACLPLHPRG